MAGCSGKKSTGFGNESSGVEVKGIEAEVYIIAGKNALVNVRGFSIRGSQGEKRFDLLLREV